MNNTNPQAIIKLPKKSILNLILDSISTLEKQEYAGSYIQGIMKAVKSWVRFNDIEITQSINVEGAESTPTLTEQEAITPNKVDNVLANGDSRSKVEIGLIAYSGLRPESLGNDNASDGVVLGDLLDFDLVELRFTSIPARVRVRDNISKAGHEYFSFLNERMCTYVIHFLKYRRSLGEKLKKDSPLIKATGHKTASNLPVTVRPEVAASPFIETRTISEELRKCIRKAGYSFRPYALRQYFDSQLMLAENNTKFSRDYRVFFMGHKGDIERRYTIGQHNLNPDVLDDMREGYQRASEFLIQTKADIQLKKMEESQAQLTNEMIVKVNEATKEITKQLLVAIGWTSANSYEEFEKELREELGREPTPQEIIDHAKDENEKHKMIDDLVKEKQRAAGIG